MEQYKEYLKTEHWQRLSEETKRLAGYRCQICNRGGEMHAHHRTYDRKGDELQGDLICVCDRHHKLIHAWEVWDEKVPPPSVMDADDFSKHLVLQIARLEIEKQKMERREKVATGILMSFKNDNDSELWERLAKIFRLEM